MMDRTDEPGTRTLARRRLLQLMLQLSLVPAAAAGACWPGRAGARPELAVPETADQALDVFQLKAVARQKLDHAAWHFLVNGADDGKTVAANRSAFDRWQIRVRRLVDVSRVDTSVSVLGEQLENPIILAPVGAQQTLHEEGELASVRAAGNRRNLMICSTVTSFSIGEIAAEASGRLWFQLYASKDQALMKKLIDDAERAGCGVLVLTVDAPARGNREGERWFRGSRPAGRMGNFENYAGPPRIGDSALTWDIVPWLRANTRMRIVLKGIVTREDAALCLKNRVDGIIVSNHGGRQEESGRGTLQSLPEVLEGVEGELPVLIDGGIRRGTDIVKALALGARAICIGRPYLYGLAAFGQAGVERSLLILRSELTRIMQLAGTTRISAITRDYLTQP
jgi:isopentenyl diphosphate isomerase/L-lactate dehydrogenase-like FMN-dependent dehydrogenase